MKTLQAHVDAYLKDKRPVLQVIEKAAKQSKEEKALKESLRNIKVKSVSWIIKKPRFINVTKLCECR
ncbi:MAG: hypothetical protein PHY47_09345 [Lachnospiraceae bacterium]|nr:hypothetical protein [Lachnospiraceae bacterium]